MVQAYRCMELMGSGSRSSAMPSMALINCDQASLRSPSSARPLRAKVANPTALRLCPTEGGAVGN